MTDIPIYLKKNFTASILGRLKLKLYELMSGRKDWLPDEQEIKHFTLQQFRSSPGIAKLFLFILSQNFLKSIRFAELEEPKNINKLLIELEEKPLEESFFLELTECPSTMPVTLGVCIYCEKLADGGYVYVTTLMDDEGFPDYLIGRLEIRANKNHPQPILGELSKGKYKNYNLKTYKKSLHGALSLRILNYVAQNQRRRFVSFQELGEGKYKDDPALCPPEDKTILALIVSASIGKIKCTQTSIPLSMIQPYSLDFCISFPMETIKWAAKEIRKGVVSPLILYWDTNSFIMSDDYPDYLAYRSLNYEVVPVVILGNFPPKCAKSPLKIGGAELIPPVRISPVNNYDSLPPDLKNWLLDRRLKSKEQSDVVSRLYGLFIGLSLMLADTSVKERQLHNFLISHPAAFDPYGSCLMSEVRLGKTYRIDLVIQYKLDEKRLLLVELEKASLPIFTKSGRLRSHVTHAIQQVEDWLQWWREHPSEIPKAFDSSIPPQGLVVIGRNLDLDEQDKKRLLHLNSNRLVKVITYDDLLNRIEALIQSLENLDRDSSDVK